MKFVFLTMITLFVSLTAMADTPKAFYQTSRGFKYMLVPGPAAMGMSYQDPRGLVWGDVMRVVQSIPESYMVRSYNEAVKACASIQTEDRRQARLPTAEEFLNLIADMGGGPSTRAEDAWRNGEFVGGDATQPALPNLKVNPFETGFDGYWTGTKSSTQPDKWGSEYAYAFQMYPYFRLNHSAHIDNAITSRFTRYGVRCVLDPQ